MLRQAHSRAEMAERLRRAVGSGPLAGNICTTASFGVAEYQPPETAKVRLKPADAALYSAKTGGRNRPRLTARLTPRRAALPCALRAHRRC